MGPDKEISAGSCTFPFPIDLVWQVIGIENRAQEDEHGGVSHRVTEDFGSGEHNCILEGTLDGMPMAATGTRRLTPYTIVEEQQFRSEDHVFITVLSKRRMKRTRVEMSLNIRPASGMAINPEKLAIARQNLLVGFERFQARALRALESWEE